MFHWVKEWEGIDVFLGLTSPLEPPYHYMLQIIALKCFQDMLLFYDKTINESLHDSKTTRKDDSISVQAIYIEEDISSSVL